jgi:hypothetical protein
MIIINRNAAISSNTLPTARGFTGNGEFRFYETLYVTTGPQEWIILPDTGIVGVILSFPQAGAAYLQATCSPPDIVSGQNVSPLGNYAPVVFTLQDVVTDLTFVSVAGPTAIRLNIEGGSCAISVRG